MKAENIVQKTTLSMHLGTIEELKTLSQITKLSFNHIMLYCLTRYIRQVKLTLRLNSATTYQQRCKSYKSFHIFLPQDLYEVCFDLRKSSKLSLSFIFALAFKMFAHELLENDENTSKDLIICDNNHNFEYFGDYICINDTHIYNFTWKQPPK